MNINLSGLSPVVSEKVSPFFKDILNLFSNVHSICIVGSSITPDFDEKISDINSLIIFNSFDIKTLGLISDLGKKYCKKRISAPLIMTLDYIYESIDVFPIEMLEFKLIHKTIYGEDIFNNIDINKEDLRLQCEREIKAKLIGLCQGYISSLGKKENIADTISRFIIGYIPLLRAVIYLLGKEPPIERSDVIKEFSILSSVQSESLSKAFSFRTVLRKLSLGELNGLFESLYDMVTKTGKFVNEINL